LIAVKTALCAARGGGVFTPGALATVYSILDLAQLQGLRVSSRAASCRGGKLSGRFAARGKHGRL